MSRRGALVVGLLAASCQQLDPGLSHRAAGQQAAWLATEERLDAEARMVAPKLEALARQPGSEAVIEALTALEAARLQLHKTRVTMVNELASPPKDPAAVEQQHKTAELRMAAATQRLEQRLAHARRLTDERSSPSAPAEKPPEKKDEPDTPPPAEPE